MASALLSMGSVTVARAQQIAAFRTQEAELHLGCQLGLVPGRSYAEKFDLLESLGYDRVEITGGNHLWMERETETLKRAIQGRNLRFSVLCIGGAKGNAGLADPALRRELIDVTKRIAVSAGELNAVGFILCPARKKIELPFPELRRRFLEEILPEILAVCKTAKTSVVLEPLNRTETMFLRQVADGAAIARDARHPNIGVMGDFWHTTFEETSDAGAFLSAGALLKHIHIASRKRRMIPGLDGAADLYVDGFRGLKLIGYRGAVSIEARYLDGGDKTVAEKKARLVTSARLLREQWKMA